MGNPKDQDHGNTADFKAIYEHSGFWSSYGYDGLSVVFDVPLEAVRTLSEPQKLALMRLLGRLAEDSDESLRDQVQEFARLTPKERLIVLVRLSEPFVP
jgi:hypothetical protein